MPSYRVQSFRLTSGHPTIRTSTNEGTGAPLCLLAFLVGVGQEQRTPSQLPLKRSFLA